jgi:hypothetical protein
MPLSKKEVTMRRQKVLQKQTGWLLGVDILLAGLGVALFGFAEWNRLQFSTWWLIYLSGSFLFIGGLFLIWNGPWCAFVKEGPTPEADRVWVGKFNLIGYTFKAYERETAEGSRQFRLSAFPSITRDEEAAIIRYLVNEGLVDNLVDGLSKRIEEEANWAFYQ